jgi:hypothetical protein
MSTIETHSISQLIELANKSQDRQIAQQIALKLQQKIKDSMYIIHKFQTYIL